jgi:cyclopropane fatty-acyl-phospholipid synthase-like methyltransferase
MKMDLALAMEEGARVSAPRIAALFDGANLNAMLDLGGGSGAYTIAMAQRFPQLRAVLCDRDDQALDLARRRIEAAGLQDRVQTRKMDILMDDFGDDYDLVFLFSVLCTLSERRGKALLKRVQEALNPGGRVVIRDHMLDDGESVPESAALFSGCMLVTTSGGQVYSRSQLKKWLNEAGFEDVHRIPTQAAQLMIGCKAR